MRFDDATASQIAFKRGGASSNDLQIEVTRNNAVQLTELLGFYGTSNSQVEWLVTNDGKSLDLRGLNLTAGAAQNWTTGGSLAGVAVASLVNAMAAFAPPAAGTSLTTADYQNRMAMLVAANV